MKHARFGLLPRIFWFNGRWPGVLYIRRSSRNSSRCACNTTTHRVCFVHAKPGSGFGRDINFGFCRFFLSSLHPVSCPKLRPTCRCHQFHCSAHVHGYNLAVLLRQPVGVGVAYLLRASRLRPRWGCLQSFLRTLRGAWLPSLSSARQRKGETTVCIKFQMRQQTAAHNNVCFRGHGRL